jgi:hypothetical protein
VAIAATPMLFLSLLLELLPAAFVALDDLKAALTDPADDEFGTKIFMTLELKDFEPSRGPIAHPPQ